MVSLHRDDKEIAAEAAEDGRHAVVVAARLLLMELRIGDVLRIERV